MVLSEKIQPTPNTVLSSSATKVPPSTVKKERRRGAKRKTTGGASTTAPSSSSSSSSPSSVQSDAPMFLRKAFFIINTCDPKIASWSRDGLSFIVKDVDRFSKEIIPRCFKHNHFSSFVRQLNFYGFRKLREEHVELENVDEEASKWCHFHHPKFQQGRPDLLKEITKNTHKDVAERTELEALRTEVKDLKSQIKNLKSDMGILASLVGDLTKQVQTTTTTSTTAAAATTATTISSSKSDKAQQPPTNKKQRLAPTPILPAPVSMQRLQSREVSNDKSVVSFTSEDEEFLKSLFAEDEFVNLPDEVLSG